MDNLFYDGEMRKIYLQLINLITGARRPTTLPAVFRSVEFCLDFSNYFKKYRQ
jgi:hypothetical protein